jgi:predicted RND superfamily exporter protein
VEDIMKGSPYMTAWFRFILRHRVLVLVVCLLITALAVLSISRASLVTDIGDMFFGDNPRFSRYLERTKQFAPDMFHVIAYEDPAPLSVESLDRLERIEKRVTSLPNVTRFESLLGAWSIPRMQKYTVAARQNPEQAETLLAELAADPLLGGLVISKDGRHVACIVEFAMEGTEKPRSGRTIVVEVFRIFQEEGIAEGKIHQAGYPAYTVEFVRQVKWNLWTLLPISGVLLLLVVFLLFRRLVPAVVSFGVAVLAMVWTMGFYTLLDTDVNVLASIIPTVVLVVSFSDIIHLWSAYRVELGNGKPREEALLNSAAEVGKACLLTSATTFVGFVCMSFVPTPVFRLLGLVLGFGVGISLLLAMTLVPIVLSYLKPPPLLAASRANGLLDRVLEGISRLTTRRPGWVAAVSAVVLLVSVYGTLHLHIETDFMKRLPPDNPVRVDQRYFQEHFYGTNTLEVFVTLPEKESLHDPALMAKVMALEDEIRKLDQVDGVLSLLDVIALMHGAFTGAKAPIPAQGYQGYLQLLQGFAGKDLKRAVDLESGTLRLAVRLNVAGFRAIHETGLAVEALAEKILEDEAEVEATGLPYLVGLWLVKIVEGQREGLAITFLVIAIMMIIGLRSLRMGLGSMIPNVLPLLVISGYVGLAWAQVDSDTFLVWMLAIGIGVDDTIHFLMRYRIESERTKDSTVALKRTYAFAGRAIIMTTAILVTGFLPLVFSEYYSIYMLGTLLPAVLIAALAADLFTVPAMVKLGIIDFPKGEGKAVRGAVRRSTRKVAGPAPGKMTKKGMHQGRQQSRFDPHPDPHPA